MLERLEDRTVLSTICLPVTSLADAGVGTLRSAIATGRLGVGETRGRETRGQTDLEFLGGETRGQTDLEFLGEKILNRSDPEKCEKCAKPQANAPTTPC